MLDFIYYLYYFRFSNRVIDNWYKRIIIRVANILLPVWFILSRYRNKYSINSNLDNVEGKYIVSLTSFPARIDKVWLTIESILRQNVKPDAIILWLYKGEFLGRESLPKNLLRLEQRGLQIRFCDENLMPHKKYYYTLLENSNANIITIDDDIIYSSFTLSNLIKSHLLFPETICCTTAREIKITENEIALYNNWNYTFNSTNPSFKYLPIGVGGVLYPPKSLNEEVLNIDKIKKLAITTDDLWLKIMSVRNKTKVVCLAGKYPRMFMPIIQKDKIKLMNNNIGNNQNDRVFRDLMKEYLIPVSALSE